MDLVNNQNYAHYVIGKICDFFYSFHEKLFEAGRGLINIAEVTDDFGMQSGLLVSPNTFDEFFKPHHQRLISWLKILTLRCFIMMMEL